MEGHFLKSSEYNINFVTLFKAIIIIMSSSHDFNYDVFNYIFQITENIIEDQLKTNLFSISMFIFCNYNNYTANALFS